MNMKSRYKSLLRHACAQAWVLLSAAHSNAQAYKAGVKDYTYTQIANPVALKTSTLNYTDATGANLTVRCGSTSSKFPVC